MSVVIRTNIANYYHPHVFNAPRRNGSPWNFVQAQGVPNASMKVLSDGRESVKIGLVVLRECRL